MFYWPSIAEHILDEMYLAPFQTSSKASLHAVLDIPLFLVMSIKPCIDKIHSSLVHPLIIYRLYFQKLSYFTHV